MHERLANHFIVSTLALAAGTFLYGCATPADSSRIQTQSGVAGPGAASLQSPGEAATLQAASKGAANESIGTVLDARPAALINGKPLTWMELRPTISELAGAEALQEVALDRKINDALTAAGITITADDAAGERKLLLESLSDDPNVAIQLLNELRDRQKLGKVRFEALMRRNAALRAMVRGKVNVTEQSIRNMHELVHGPKRQPRIMVLPNLETAQAAINLMNSGVSFGDVAVEMSTDSSAARGGLLEPISNADPAYPEAIRQTLWTLNPGEVSGPVLIDDRYAVVMLVRRVAGTGVRLEDAKTSLERLVRIQQERLLMDQLARSLMSQTQVTVFDDVLHESWSKRGRGKP